MKLTYFRIYDGKQKNKASKVFFGEASGIRDYDDIRYPAMLKYSKDFFGGYWGEDEIKLAKDVEEYREKLSDRERYVYKIITGSLNWLDSIATDVNFALGFLCTDPSVRSCLGLITSFEQLHNRSLHGLTICIITVINQSIFF